MPRDDIPTLHTLVSLYENPAKTVKHLPKKGFKDAVRLVFIFGFIYSAYALLFSVDEFVGRYAVGLAIFTLLFVPVWLFILFLIASGAFWFISKIFGGKGNFQGFMYLYSLCLPLLFLSILIKAALNFFIGAMLQS